jgi:hypothetical protein
VDRKELAPGQRVYQFKGFRETVTEPEEYSSGKHREMESTNIGSVFYADIQAHGTGSMLALSGWSTVNGNETCTTLEPGPFGGAYQLERSHYWMAGKPLSGKEEAGIIRGLVIELGLTQSASPPSDP